MSMKKLVYIVLGCIGVGLGAVGAVLPILPTFPFLMASAYCFARSSEKLNRWFMSTKLYKNNLETYVQGRGMTIEAKKRVILTVTLLMGMGFFLMFQKGVYGGCTVLFFVWLFHVIYFIKGVKTFVVTEKSR